MPPACTGTPPRAYDAAIGRFVSPDILVPDPSNPQSLNRYSYVYNNPLKYNDPSGNSPEWFNEAWGKRIPYGAQQGPGGWQLHLSIRNYGSSDGVDAGDAWRLHE